MKFIHLSDLHLGKRVNEYSMLDDQAYILTKIIGVIDEEKPDGVLIAGDIYDKPIPPAEAVELFDNFLVRLSKRNLQVFIISGNHDSPERLSFGNQLMQESGVYISPVYNGNVSSITMFDSFGEVNVFLLPFVKPATVRRLFSDSEINSYTDAVDSAINEMNIDTNKRNILVAHQFVTGAVEGGSEELYVGGSENIDSSVFRSFDYVALGHIHGPQNISSEHIRYCGTPLKYSFSEARHKKSITVVELFEKNNLTVRTVPLIPKRDLVEIKGTFCELTNKDFYENTTLSEDYTHITLTDENDIPDAVGKLRVIYRNLMRIDYDNKRTRNNSIIIGDINTKVKSPIELFEEFYVLQNGSEMNDEQRAYVTELFEKIQEAAK